MIVPTLALVSVYIIEEVANDHAQNAPLVKNWARSCAQAAERDLLVAYPLIDIHVLIAFWIWSVAHFEVCSPCWSDNVTV